MTAPLAGLLLAIGAHQDAPDVVKLLGQDVPIVFPTGGPIASGASSPEGAGWKWEVTANGSIGRRFHKDGGWGDLKDLYDASKGRTDRKPYPVKVFIHKFGATVQETKLGVVRQHFAAIDDEDLQTLLRSLAVFKASVEGVTGGAYDVKLDVTVDDDTEVSVITGDTFDRQATGPAPRLTAKDFAATGLGSQPQRDLLAQEIGAQVNDERFETDDGVYRGPFAAVFDIHATPMTGCEIGFIDHTPVASFGFYTISDIAAKRSLPTALFEAWKTMVVASACPAGPVASRLESRDGFEYPTIVDGPVWKALVERSLRSSIWALGSAELTTENLALLSTTGLPILDLGPDSGPPVVASPKGAGRSLVSLDVADLLLARLAGKSVAVTGLASAPGGGYLEVQGSPEEIKALLSAQGAGATPLVQNLREPGKVVGDFTATIGQGPNGDRCWDIKFTGPTARGHVVLATGNPFITAGQDGFLAFDAKLSTDENISVELVDGQGSVVGRVNVGGESLGLERGPTSFDADVPADEQWHHVAAPLKTVTGGKAVATVRLVGGFERLSRGAVGFSFTEPKTTPDGPASAERSSTDPAIEIAQTTGTLNADQAKAVESAVRSPNMNLKLTALAVLGRVKSPDSVAALTEASRSGYVPVAMYAVRALAFQDTPDAWAQVRDCVEHGPFDHNRRFAAAVLAQRPDPGMANSLNFMYAKNWRARLEAARALGAIKTTSSAIIMGAMLQTEPNPVVRLELAAGADATVEHVAKRLVYTAVNDPSQWVRATAYGRLIDSPFKNVQSDALKGVRDDAVGVRLHLLALMRERAKDDYRPALRLAVTDMLPVVRIAALKAFATQPGPVDPNEVKNTWTDTDPGVKAALQELAKAKGFKVPNA